MAGSEKGFGRSWQQLRAWLGQRPAVLPLLVLGAGLIALAAGPTPNEQSWTGIPSDAVVRWTIAIIVGCLCLLGLIMLLAARGPAAKGEQQRKPWKAALVGYLVLFALLSLTDFEGEPPELEELEEAPLELTEAPPGPEIAPGPGFESGDMTALLVILAAALAVLFWTRRPGPEPEPDSDEADADSPLAASVSRAEEFLLAGDDPRQAVLLAYRDLERTLESLDLARADTETPTEHLTRALASLSITDQTQARPLQDLAELYSRARYSQHPITTAEQQRAGEALGRARRQLAGNGP
ncbi:MAG: DUF4129 domain-containing protein [Actinomycetota bacterium]